MNAILLRDRHGRIERLAARRQPLEERAAHASGAAADPWPPATARQFGVVSSAEQCGTAALRRLPDGAQALRQTVLLRGQVWVPDQTVQLGRNAQPALIAGGGVTPSDNAGEIFDIADGKATCKTQIDGACVAWTARPSAQYTVPSTGRPVVLEANGTASSGAGVIALRPPTCADRFDLIQKAKIEALVRRNPGIAWRLGQVAPTSVAFTHVVAKKTVVDPIVVGTDGFDIEIECELERYVKAELTPAQALQPATVVPTRLVGADTRTGSITVGKLADLVLGVGDPSQRISDMRKTL